jgi:ABC-type branched-subunit amino acid transport system substrate-binding protein
MKNTREIRLEWNTDDYTFDDYIVPTKLSDDTIQNAIDIALAYGEDESGYLVRILEEQGYSIKLIAIENKIIFDFNMPENEDYLELDKDKLDEIVELKTRVKKFVSKSKETKEIRLEWNTDDYTFDDYIIPSDIPNEVIQEAIDIALAYREDESGYLVRILKSQGIEVKLIEIKDKTVFDFNTPLTEDYIEMDKEELDKEVKKITTTKTTTTKSLK